MIISERIFYMMEKKNMTQLELSKRTGIATSNISDWKKKKTNPKADCLLSICDALEITPEQLLTGKGIDPEYKDAPGICFSGFTKQENVSITSPPLIFIIPISVIFSVLYESPVVSKSNTQ